MAEQTPTVRVIGREGWWELLRRPWHVRCSVCRTIGRHQLLAAAQAQAEAHRLAHEIGNAMAEAFRELTADRPVPPARLIVDLEGAERLITDAAALADDDGMGGGARVD